MQSGNHAHLQLSSWAVRIGRTGHVVKSQVISGLNPKQKFVLRVLNSGVIGFNQNNTRPDLVKY